MLYLKEILYIYTDLFTHKDINTYINGVVKICLNKFYWIEGGGDRVSVHLLWRFWTAEELVFA